MCIHGLNILSDFLLMTFQPDFGIYIRCVIQTTFLRSHTSPIFSFYISSSFLFFTRPSIALSFLLLFLLSLPSVRTYLNIRILRPRILCYQKTGARSSRHFTGWSRLEVQRRFRRSLSWSCVFHEIRRLYFSGFYLQLRKCRRYFCQLDPRR